MTRSWSPGADAADIEGHLLDGRAGTVPGRRLHHLFPTSFRDFLDDIQEGRWTVNDTIGYARTAFSLDEGQARSLRRPSSAGRWAWRCPLAGGGCRLGAP